MKYVVPVICLLAFSVVHADESRTVNMQTTIKDEKGKPAKDFAYVTKEDPTCANCSLLTVGVVIARALNATFPDERDLSGEQKWARSVLADRLKDNKAATLTVKEADLIEKLVGKAFGGETIKQVVPLIDPNKKTPEIQ